MKTKTHFVTVLHGYGSAWQLPSRVQRLGDGTTRRSGRIRNDVSDCFPAPIVGLIFAVADAQS